MVWDRDTGKATLYRDGKNVGETESPTGIKPITTGFRIGNDCAGPFKGVIDEVGIFNAALTGNEIENIATKGMEWALDPAAVDIYGKLLSRPDRQPIQIEGIGFSEGVALGGQGAGQEQNHQCQCNSFHSILIHTGHNSPAIN